MNYTNCRMGQALGEHDLLRCYAAELLNIAFYPPKHMYVLKLAKFSAFLFGRHDTLS